MPDSMDPVERAAGAAPQFPRPARGTLGAGRALRRRLLVHHVPLALASAAGLLMLLRLRPSDSTFSVAQLASPTGDVALVLLALTLLIGPASLVLRRRS